MKKLTVSIVLLASVMFATKVSLAQEVTNNIIHQISKKADKGELYDYYVNKDKGQIERNIKTNDFKLIDARSSERFNGLVPEPRKGLNSGSIKNSLNFPFIECINKSDSTFKSPDELLKIFQKYNALGSKDIVFTCGSGVTACILGLANSIISGKTPMIYDGSWSEYGLKNK